MGFFDIFNKNEYKQEHDRGCQSVSTRDIASTIAGLIDNTDLEILMNKETKLILFKDPYSDPAGLLNVYFLADQRFSSKSFKPLAEVLFNSLGVYHNFIEARRHDLPGCGTFTDMMAIDAAQKLLKQADLL